MIRPKLTYKTAPPTRAIASVIRIPDDVNKAVNEEMSAIARDMQVYAKDSHPWQNRTGRAEEGLTGYSGAYGGAVAGPGRKVFYAALRHGKDVFYGIFLEVKHGGRWGIIQRTLEAFVGQIPGRIVNAINEAVR